MANLLLERPSIHVALTGGADEKLAQWVEIGAEEEGVPATRVGSSTHDIVAAAYSAAESSRFDIGVAISPDSIVLHEVHMPPGQPVLRFDLAELATARCRRMGSNAARLIARLPLRIDDEPETPASEPKARSASVPDHNQNSTPKLGSWSDDEVKRIASIVARIVRERGVH